MDEDKDFTAENYAKLMAKMEGKEEHVLPTIQMLAPVQPSKKERMPKDSIMIKVSKYTISLSGN